MRSKAVFLLPVQSCNGFATKWALLNPLRKSKHLPAKCLTRAVYGLSRRFVGLGAPYWDPDARGMLIGLTRGTNRAHIARAALEAIAFQSAEVLTAMAKDATRPVRELRVDGGAARNDLLMQMQADIAGVPVIRPAQTETTALGAAFLAGLASGFWQSTDEIASLWRAERVFEPVMNEDQRGFLMNQWARAVGRARKWNQ